jgi:acetolactate synthase-1/2/3 large subunit
MADGYARATGRVGVCAVVPGPGVLNAGAALSTAYACNSPVLCLVGQVPDRDLGQGRGALHEIPDQLAVLRGTIGWAEHATHPDQVPGLVDEAFTRLCRPGRRRPAAIELPWDMLMATSDATYPSQPVLPPAKAPDATIVAWPV